MLGTGYFLKIAKISSHKTQKNCESAKIRATRQTENMHCDIKPPKLLSQTTSQISSTIIIIIHLPQSRFFLQQYLSHSPQLLRFYHTHQKAQPAVILSVSYHRKKTWNIMFQFKVFIRKGHIIIYAGNTCAITLRQKYYQQDKSKICVKCPI